ncbi:MAG: hypothetical protein WC356_04950 [Candidatus Micrarchaeia archaeon]|jgi:FKBP-type peptidyl-prolyl cis-trans isomerase 2
MEENELIQIIYTTQDDDTKDIVEERTEPLLLQLKNSSLPDKIKEGLKNMKEGDEKEIFAEKPFGNREKDLINVVPLKQFTKNKINPFPGLIVDLDGYKALIKAVSGGRVVVDFNHLLAGRNLRYKIKLLKILKENKDKIIELAKSQDLDVNVDIQDKKANVKLIDKGDKETFTRRKNTLFLALKQFVPDLEIKLE